MTLCVGIEKRGRVWIGADSGSVYGSTGKVDLLHEPKVWRQQGWVVAMAGDGLAGNLVRIAARLPKPPDNPTDAYKVVSLDVIQEFRRTFSAHGYEPDTKAVADEDNANYSWWLIGAKNAGLFFIEDSFCVFRMTECAIGMADYAEGWLDGSPIVEPELRIKECIKSASKRLPGAVKLPVVVLEG